VFLQAALPAVRCDYTAFETYEYDSGTIKSRQLNCKIQVFSCSEDQYTPSAESIEGWHEMTDVECEVVRIEQGSQFVFMEKDQMQMIVEALLLL